MMPLVLDHCGISIHPITSLTYPTVTKTFTFGSKSLVVEHFDDVEKSIDLVFDWLDQRGFSASDIEHLAPYFGAIWPSAIALSEWLAQEGDQGRLSGAKVMEIGCGLGVPGLLAAHHGSAVTLSDWHPDVPRFLDRKAVKHE